MDATNMNKFIVRNTRLDLYLTVHAEDKETATKAASHYWPGEPIAICPWGKSTQEDLNILSARADAQANGGLGPYPLLSFFILCLILGFGIAIPLALVL